MVTKNVYLRLFVFSALFVFVMTMNGCETTPDRTDTSTADTLRIAEGADMQRTTEVQIVEQMAHYRRLYQEHLKLLQDFYDRQGNHLKSNWAVEEWENLTLGPRHSYLVVAELAGPDLRAAVSIVEADLLYNEGTKLYRQGRGKIGSLFSDKKKLYLAMDKFNELITKYPDSDKIDDAAFQVGQIYHKWLKDYHKALLYYQRVWQWDPQTPLPARFAVARVYDEFMHDRAKALQYYQLSVNLETAWPNKVEYAQGRIREISAELSK